MERVDGARGHAAAPIIAALNRETLRCQEKPEVKARMEAGSYEPGMLTPERIRRADRQGPEDMDQVVRETGVQIKA